MDLSLLCEPSIPCNDDLNNAEQGYTNEIKLQVGDVFGDWNSVHIAVEAFAKNHGFVANKNRKNLDPIYKTIIRRQEYVCWKFGINQAKKVADISIHHDSASGKTNCPWHVNFYLGRRSGVIKLTQFSDHHNHQCNSEIIDLAPKNLKLPQAILDKIEHYTISGRLGAGQQYNLLVSEFPEYNIKKKNLYNAISKFRGVQIHNEFDAAKMLLYLLKQRDEDQEYVVIPHFEGANNELTGLFWMTGQQCNDLWLKFHDVIIHDNTAKTNRYDMALSLFVCIDNNFKTRIVGQALIKYETQAAYEWIFRCVLNSVDNVYPKVIFTDSDPAVIAAIQAVYPQAYHLLCIYHIVENVKKKARSKLRGDLVKNFIEDFYHMRNSYSQG